MYLIGEGVPQDLMLAFMWLNISASLGNQDAVESKNTASSVLTPESTDCRTGITCEHRKICMGDVHFTSDPLSGEFKFEVVGERNPLDAKGSLVWFIPVQGLADKVLLRVRTRSHFIARTRRLRRERWLRGILSGICRSVWRHASSPSGART